MQEYNGPERRDNWYTNKDLFEMVQNLSKELQDTRIAIKKYNGLHEALAKACTDIKEVESRVGTIEQQKRGKKEFGEAIVMWGGWGVSIITLLYILGFLGGV